MTSRKLHHLLVIAVTVAGAGGYLASWSYSAASTTVSALAKKTHFHGISVDPSDSSRVYLATHHGLYILTPDGGASRVSASQDDFMGFTAHPSDPSVIYASGHPAGGGNLGVIASADGGQSWKKISNGVGGPVDFHQMDVSKADPEVIYGVHRGLQRSADGGRTWTKIGQVPAGLVDLAASGKDTDTLYAATKSGLFKSVDAGRNWQQAHLIKRPATMVHVARQGGVYAFIVGTGLVRAADPGVTWWLVSSAVGQGYVLHLAVDAGDDRNLYAVTFDPETRAQAILTSRDGGETWTMLNGDGT